MASGVVIKEQNVQMVFNHLKDKLAEHEKKLNQEEKTYGELLQIRKKKLEDSEVSITSGFLSVTSETIIWLVLALFRS